jgi:hypothetical protein
MIALHTWSVSNAWYQSVSWGGGLGASCLCLALVCRITARESSSSTGSMDSCARSACIVPILDWSKLMRTCIVILVWVHAWFCVCAHPRTCIVQESYACTAISRYVERNLILRDLCISHTYIHTCIYTYFKLLSKGPLPYGISVKYMHTYIHTYIHTHTYTYTIIMHT